MANLSTFYNDTPKFVVEKMFRACDYWRDLGELSKIPFQEYYDLVKSIPYDTDSNLLNSAQLVARPKNLINAKSLDCKKKSILIGAWCNAQTPKKKFCFVVSSERPDKEFHHVFPIVEIEGIFYIADPTYFHYNLGVGKKNLTNWKVMRKS